MPRSNRFSSAWQQISLLYRQRPRCSSPQKQLQLRPFYSVLCTNCRVSVLAPRVRVGLVHPESTQRIWGMQRCNSKDGPSSLSRYNLWIIDTVKSLFTSFRSSRLLASQLAAMNYCRASVMGSFINLGTQNSIKFNKVHLFMREKYNRTMKGIEISSSGNGRAHNTSGQLDNKLLGWNFPDLPILWPQVCKVSISWVGKTGVMYRPISLVSIFIVLVVVRETISTELTFELPANDKQCFYEEIKKGISTTLEFQVSSLPCSRSHSCWHTHCHSQI